MDSKSRALCENWRRSSKAAAFLIADSGEEFFLVIRDDDFGRIPFQPGIPRQKPVKI
jgi:hypothetical protein